MGSSSFKILGTVFLTFFPLMSGFTASAETEEMPSYEVDRNKNVVFTVLLENLTLSQSEVFQAALDYLNNEYKISKYEIAYNLPEKGIIVGAATLNSFYENNGLRSSSIFSVDYQLRVDAKEGRARVQVILTDYKETELSDTGNKKVIETLISEVAPVSDNKSGNKKKFKKAFEKLQEYVERILDSTTQSLKNARPTPDASDNW